MEKDLHFTTSLSYEDCCHLLQTLSNWQWRRGDSDIFGRHMKGHNVAGDVVELYYLEGYRLELYSKDAKTMRQLENTVLQLLQGTAIVSAH